MPIYEISSPDGKTLKLEGDKPPSLEVIKAAFSSPPKQKPGLTFSKMAESVKKSPLKEGEIPEDKENLLFRLLDDANRLGYGVANTVYQAVIKGDHEYAKNYIDGLTLKEKKSFGNILNEKYNPESKLGKVATAVSGFGLDVATDPLSWVGLGLAGKAGKLVKGGTSASKALKAKRAASKGTGLFKGAEDSQAVLTLAGKKIPGSGYIAEPIAQKLGKAGQVIREDLGPISEVIDKLKYVSPKFRPKGVDPVEWNKYLTAFAKAKNIQRSAEFTTLEKSKRIHKAFKDEGLGDEAVSKVTNAIETKGEVTSKGGILAKEARDEFQSTYQKVGPTGKQVIGEDGYEYLPHVSVKKNDKLQNAIGVKAREFTTKSPSDIKRTILKYTDESGEEFVMSTKNGKVFKDGKQINKFNPKKVSELQESGKLSQASIADINKAYGDTVFSAKLPELIAIQGMRTAKVVGGDELFKNVSQFASKTPKTVKGVDYMESTAPELAGKYFHPEIVKHIDATRQKLVNPKEIHEALKIFDTTQNIWKSTATYWNVAFHTRNSVSNVWQNSIAGVNNPLDYAKATKIQFKLRDKKYGLFGKDLKGLENLAPDEQKIVKEYREQGLSRVGHLSGDIAQSIESEIMSTMDLLKKKKPGQVLNKIGGAAGDAIEGNAKLAHFIAKRKEGFSAFDAGESVKKYLFDYEDLTTVEKEVFKRILPFYTFTRKNIPIQLETLIKNPARQSKLIKAKNNVEILTGDDKTQHILPEWLKDSAPVHVGNKDGKVRYIKLEGFLPVADLNKFSGGAKDLLNMVSPVIKAPTEQLANHNFFFGRKITKHKGLKEGFTGRGEKDLLWAKVPARIEHLARLFRPINEIDKIIGKKYRGNSGLSKAMNLVLGGKVYEYETRELLNKFNRLSDEEARNIKSDINWLKKEIRRKPELRDENREEIKNLYDKYKKSKRISFKRKRKAREALR